MIINTGTCWRNTGLKYTVMILWLSVCAVLFWDTYQTYKYNPEYYYAHNILGSWLCISRGSAAVLNLNCGLLLLPMCRTTVSLLRQCQNMARVGSLNQIFAALKGFHMTCSYSVVFLAAIHFVAHVSNARNFSERFDHKHKNVNAAAFPGQDPALVILGTVPGVTGVLMMVALLCIVSSSTKYVRTNNYNHFWYSHRVLFLLFFGLLMVHGIRGPIRRQTNTDSHTPGCNSTLPQPEYIPETGSVCDDHPKFDHIGCSTWKWVSLPLCLYTCDLVYRCVRRSRKMATLHAELISADIVRLDVRPIKSQFAFAAGQYVYLSVPEISSLEWHPFSVCRNETGEGSFRLYIKVFGDWTAKLRDHVTSHTENDEIENTSSASVFIDGPYASPLEHLSDYPVSICIAGGIGITPFISHIQTLIHNDQSNTRCRRLYVMWVVPDRATLSLFEEEFLLLHQHCYEVNVPDFLEASFHVTSTPSQTSPCEGFLRGRISYGRPAWKDTLGDYIKRHTKTKIGIFVCGPRGMITDVRRTATALSEHSNRLYLHHESF